MPHIDAPLPGQRGVALRQAPLQSRSAFNRVNHAAELREQAVTHELEDAPMLPLDLWFKEILPMCAQPMKGVCLILLHESAIADDVSSKNGRQAALNAFLGHINSRLLGAVHNSIRPRVGESTGLHFRSGSCVASITGRNGSAQTPSEEPSQSNRSPGFGNALFGDEPVVASSTSWQMPSPTPEEKTCATLEEAGLPIR
jgi:hypothetical protein